MNNPWIDKRLYVCDDYMVLVPSKCCLFCEHCTDVYWDYINGPYMFICELGIEGKLRAFNNLCESFERDFNC